MNQIPPYFDDFERWCEECVMVADKLTGLPVPLILNAPQRRLARIMESQRRAGRPVRIILLKARQWGGSTLVQAYMAWHQLVRAKGRNALICAHVKDAAALIRATYSLLLDSYPETLKDPNPADWKLRPYQQTQGSLWIPARNARIAITSANNPDSLRGASYHMAHLSEAAFWADGDTRAASAIVRTVCGTVPSEPETVIVIESTADGPDNWFAQEWRRAVAGRSDKTPVFVPWYEIEIYRRSLTSEQRAALPAQLDDYELRLLAQGVCPEALAWYHEKRREYATHAEMMAEFPSTPTEAFATSARSPFASYLPADLVASPSAPLPVPSLLVASLGSRISLSEFGVLHGKIHALADHPVSDPALLMNLISGLLRPGMELAIIEAPQPSAPRHGRWCLRAARRAALPLCYAADEPLLTLTEELLDELIDLHIHLLQQEAVADTDAAAAEAYRLFDPQRPYRSATILARLGASLLLEPRLSASPLSPADFLNP